MNSQKATKEPLSLEYWVKQLTQKDMPAFAHTARIIAGEASREESSAACLAKFILQDPSMTVRLLKMANSPFFNPRQTPINTVSRAIVLLGFKTVRNLCMSISILDSIVDGPHKKHVVSGLADCFHAAIQARAIAKLRNDRSPEEVFIAALLRQLGQFSFWTFAKNIDNEMCHALGQEMEQSDPNNPASEKTTLGFSFDELTNALNDEWKISTLLNKTLSVNDHTDPRVSSVVLAHEIASVAKKGWNSDEMKALMKRLSESLYMPVSAVRTMVENNAEVASKTLTKLGASSVANLITTAKDDEKIKQSNELVINKKNKKEVKLVNLRNSSDSVNDRNFDSEPHRQQLSFHQPDSNLQIQILSDICQLIDEKPDLHLMIEMIMEGIHRGVGMDRVIFALLSPNKQHIKAKYTLGLEKNENASGFDFPLNMNTKELFALTLSKQQMVWLTLDKSDVLTHLIMPPVLKFNNNAPFFLSHVSIGPNPIGLIYADRNLSQRNLDETTFMSFKLFCQQASLGLAKIKS